LYHFIIILNIKFILRN